MMEKEGKYVFNNLLIEKVAVDRSKIHNALAYQVTSYSTIAGLPQSFSGIQVTSNWGIVKVANFWAVQ